jgi:uncharacterized protein (DUF433 family)
MNEQELLKRITANPEIFGGKPIIRGMRISVELILSLLAQGESEDAILADYPDLARKVKPTTALRLLTRRPQVRALVAEPGGARTPQAIRLI